MGYTLASTSDVESVIPEEWGGMWFFRDALDCEQLGITLLELEPSGKGKEHDHNGAGHEEVYLVVDGTLTVELEPVREGDTEERSTRVEEIIEAGEAIRVDPRTTRQLFNRGDDRVRVVVAGAP